jgi:hypothetical protein
MSIVTNLLDARRYMEANNFYKVRNMPDRHALEWAVEYLNILYAAAGCLDS